MHALERMAALLRAAAMLALLLTLSGVAGWPNASAQDDEQTEPPVPEGVLVIRTAVCTVEAEPPVPAALLTEDELAGETTCVDGPPAFVFVDDFEAFEAPSGTEVALEVGLHTLTDANSGASREFEIVEAVVSTLVVTTYEVVLPTETPTEVSEAEPIATETSEPVVEAASVGSVTLVTHLCRQGIGATAELDGIATWGQQLVACPVVVLENDAAAVTEGAVTANDPVVPLTYDQTVAYEDGTSVARSLGEGTFAQAAVCESDLAESLNGVDSDDRCYDQSGYAFPDIPAGPVTVTSTDAPGQEPAEFTFLTAKTAPGAISDAGVIQDPGDGTDTVELDTSVAPDVTVHLFFAPEPIEGQVTIVGHLCPAAIESRNDFNALGDVEDKLAACGSITLPGNPAPPEGATAGEQTFAVTVQGADAISQAIPGLPFAPATVCERNLPASIDDDPSNDLCLDASGYVADDILQGEIRVAATTPPAGARFVAAEIGPDPDDTDAVITARGTTGLTRIDTTGDGNVVVHVFFVPVPVATATLIPTKTATPTKTPTKTPTNTPRPTRTSTPRPINTPTHTPILRNTPPPDVSGPATSTAVTAPTATGAPSVSSADDPGLVMVDDAPIIPPPNLGEEPPPVQSSVDDFGDPDVIDGEGIPEPVVAPAADPFGNIEDPAADPFGNIEDPAADPFGDAGDDVTAEEIAEEQKAAAEVAKVDGGEDLPTVGTARATPSATPLWLILAGLGLVGVGLVTGRRRYTGIS